MKRQYSLDLARLIAAYFVLFGHFVLSGTFDETSRTWVGSAEILPLLNKSGQTLWMLDIYLLEKWKTATAIWGVALFFLISGWVVPPMLSRYSRKQFLINRFFRIFPMLVVAVIVAAAIQYQFGDRLSLTIGNVLSTMTLTNQFTVHPLTLGVVWTLMIEFKFYLLITILGRLNCVKILWAVASMFILLALQIGLVKSEIYSTSPEAMKVANSIIHDFCFMIFMLCGSAFWIIINQSKASITSVGTFLLILLSYNIYRYICINELGIHLYQDINLSTQFIVSLLFGLCLLIQKYFPYENPITRVVCALSNVTYSLYLLHVSLGFFLLSRLRHVIENQYLLLVAVTIVVTLISAGTYRFIEVPGNMLGKKITQSRYFN
ncbi:acyltransferase family protein [Dickeya fangzhongdai]|uniref:acyltransferase family protein n=1 Tax=Dickeya fangzhongdai TaxID=1778540 RepID=UPI0026DFD3CC|nr:acyltransferase [Dickeya fangzhongdai]WKV48896.1 acyltransferase [Dickeya fangzhongdai]